MQDGIWEYLEDSISAFTQGYNVSVLAYGQSGAGKSYTMGTSRPGELDDDSMIGKKHPALVAGRCVVNGAFASAKGEVG